MRAYIPPDEIRRIVKRFAPTEQKMRAVGVFLHNQTKSRFATHGSSGGSPWADKWVKGIGRDDGRAQLTGSSGQLLKSFGSYADRISATLYSDAPYAHVHEKGTVGKGGSLPNITPRKAKVLFIPISERAKAGWHADLIKGRFIDGQLTPPNADYVLLPSVSIPPRPMLPTGNHERQEQIRFVAETLKS